MFMLQIETFKEISKHHPLPEIFKILRKVVNFRKMIHFLLFTVAKYARYNFLKEGFSCLFHWKLIIALSFSSGFIRFSFTIWRNSGAKIFLGVVASFDATVRDSFRRRELEFGNKTTLRFYHSWLKKLHPLRYSA